MPECLTIQFKLPANLLGNVGAPGRKIIGDMIAAAESGSEVGEAMLPLVHRVRQSDGRLLTAPGMSAFRVFGNEHSFYLRALGDQASQYLASNVHHVAGWLSRRAGTTVPMSWDGGIVNLSASRSLKAYFINGLVLARPVVSSKRRPRTEKIRQHQAFFQACCNQDPESIDTAYLVSKIQRGLEAQCDLIGVDVPDDGLLIEVLDVPRTKLIEVLPGQAWPAVNVKFALNARLGGPWNIGPGASKGLGRIVMDRPQVMEQAA
jgi:hypothetical protein